jgi:hypothetical protein
MVKAKTTKQQDYKEAVLVAKREAYESFLPKPNFVCQSHKYHTR